MKGIDLSVHNGTVDFSNMNLAGIDFVIIRAGYGDAMTYPSQNDSQFERNYTAKTGSIVAALGDTFTHGGKIYPVQPGTSVQVCYEGVKNYEVY